jgi:4-amino-4-deoxy-L-arabinose transferase-like glycosyltransferase
MNRGTGAPPLPASPWGVPTSVWWLVLAACVVKLAIFVVVSRERPGFPIHFDTQTYVQPALALLKAGTFSPSPAEVPTPEVNRTPGYPVFLALVMRLFGEGLVAPGMANIVFSTLAALAVGALAFRFFGGRAALVATAVATLDPAIWQNSMAVTTEPLFCLLMIAGLASLVVSFTDPARANAAAAAGGVLLALATLVRPILVPALPLFALLVAWGQHRLGARRGRCLVVAAFFTLGPLAGVGGWMVRNWLRAGDFTMSWVSVSDLYFVRAAAVEAAVKGVRLQEVMDSPERREMKFRLGYVRDEFGEFGGRTYAALYPRNAHRPLADLVSEWRTESVRTLRAHPWTALAMTARSAVELLFFPSSATLFLFRAGFLSPGPELERAWFSLDGADVLRVLRDLYPMAFWLSVASTVLLLAVWTAVLRGLRSLHRPWADPVHLLLVGTSLYLVAVSSGPAAMEDRLRVPIVALMAVYAGARNGKSPGPTGPGAAVSGSPASAGGPG